MDTSIVPIIPSIMEANNFSMGKQLMDKWLEREHAVAPDYSPAVTNVINMNWVLGFQRARIVYDRLKEEKIWANQKAIPEIYKMLRSEKLVDNSMHSFDFLQTPSEAYRTYINHRAVGTPFSPDDLLAALGNFAFYVAIKGSIGPEQKDRVTGHKLIISEVGVVVWDKYDFNGDQFLGYWNRKDKTVSLYDFFAGEWVDNATFRAWRDADRDHGGDFEVFSDVVRIAIDPVTFWLRDPKP